MNYPHHVNGWELYDNDSIGFLLAGKIVGKIDKPKLTKLVYTAVGISGFLYLMGL